MRCFDRMVSQLNGFEWYRIDLPCFVMIVSQLNRTELHHIDSIKMTSNRLTMILCDDSESIESNRMHRIDSIKVTLNRLTMMLGDDSESIESNRITSYRFDQDDVELIDHDALR